MQFLLLLVTAWTCWLQVGCAIWVARHSFRPFLMTCFFAEQVLTQLDLLTYWKETATCKNEVYYFLPNQLDEKMAIQPPCVMVHKLMDAMSSCCVVPG